MLNSSQVPMNGARKFPRKDETATKLITPRHVLNALRKWWLFALCIGILAASTVAAIVLNTFKPEYVASAWLRIESDQPYVAFQERGGSLAFVSNQVELIRSPLVLEPLLSIPEIARIPEIQKANVPMNWIASNLAVKSIGGSDIFTISFKASDGHDAARVVNAVYDAYSAQRGDDEAKRTQRVLDLLRVEQSKRQLDLKGLQENVRELSKQAIIKNPLQGQAKPSEVIQHPLATLQQQRSEQEVEIEVLKARVAALQESFQEKPVEGIAVSPSDVKRMIDENPRVQAMELGLEQQRARLQDYASKLKAYAQDPNYQQLQSEITAEQRRIEQYREGLRPVAEAAIRESVENQRQDEMKGLQSQLNTFRLTKDLLDERYKHEEENLKNATGETLDVEFLRADMERAARVYDLITERILRIETEKQAPERVVLLKEAEPALSPVTSTPIKQILFGAVVAFFSPFVLAVGWERLAERISHSEQIEEEAHVPIIGEIATLPRHTKSSHPTLRKSDSQSVLVYQESFDNLRTMLVLAEELKDAQVLAVTSASNNEGKTSVSVQLAASLARATTENVLLIDGDMRSPDIHRVLQIPSDLGLAEVLSGKCRIEEAVTRGWSDNVDVLLAGRLHGVPHMLVGNGALNEVLSYCRKNYRYVVIDTPPILAASEALVLAKAADAALLVTMRDVSRMAQVQQAYQRLVASGANAIGAVLNGVPTRRYTYRYGHYAYSSSEDDA